jgi:hypothetical protein
MYIITRNFVVVQQGNNDKKESFTVVHNSKRLDQVYHSNEKIENQVFFPNNFVQP